MRNVLIATLVMGAALLAAGGVGAQDINARLSTAEPDVGPGERPFVEPPVYRSENGRLEIELDVVMVEVGDEVYRLYADPKTGRPMVPGPTWAIRAGDQVTLTVNNTMPNTAPDEPPLPVSDRPTSTINGPHGFNITNMHTHGLWVSPAGNSDNVLNRVQPQTSFTYEYQLPKEHWAGTMWYHPHNHGSTATQVASGMAGALIIEGGLDDMAGMPGPDDDHILVLQQILGSKRVAKIAGLTGDIDTALDPATVHTSVNGEWRPTLTLSDNRVQRLRLINAASHDNQVIQIAPYDPANPQARESLVSMFPVAFDGVAAAGEIKGYDTIMLAPGNRVDILISLPDGPAGRAYTIWSLDDGAGTNTVKFDERIGYIVVDKPGQAVGQIPRLIPAEYGPVSHLIADGTKMDVNRQLLFSVPAKPAGGVNFYIDNHPFENDVISQTVYEGAVEQWTMTNNNNSVHPFHIHVNPFKVTSVDIRGYEQAYDGYLPRYYQMRMGHYMDTVLIPPARKFHTNGDLVEGTFTMQSRFLRFIGSYVLHCHILSHEDAGMMQLVEVIGNPGDRSAKASHH